MEREGVEMGMAERRFRGICPLDHNEVVRQKQEELFNDSNINGRTGKSYRST